MSRQIIEANGRAFTFSPDDAPPIAERTWAIVSAHLTDELTGQSLRSQFSIVSDRPGLAPRTSRDGIGGVVGIPARLFPDLNLNDHVVDLTFVAGGYVPHQELVVLAQNPDFPGTFFPARIDLALHRQPVTVRGRVVDAATMPKSAIAGATIRFTGIYRRLPPAHLSATPEAPNIVSLQPPLYSARPAAANVLRRRQMAPVIGEDKQLLQPANSGDRHLALSDRVNLVASDTILIDPGAPDRQEFMTVEEVAGSSAADQPATVRLAHAPAYSHLVNTTVRKAIPQAPGPDNDLNADAIAGDSCVLLTGLDGLSTASVVEVTDGVTSEYHNISLFSVATDADGYYRLPPISRVACFELEVSDGLRIITPSHSPDYTRRENPVDFVFN